MNLRLGLQAKFLVGMGVVLLVVLALMGLMWQRQNAMQAEVSGAGREAMRQLISERLKRRGESTVTQLAESLDGLVVRLLERGIGSTDAGEFALTLREGIGDQTLGLSNTRVAGEFVGAQRHAISVSLPS